MRNNSWVAETVNRTIVGSVLVAFAASALGIGVGAIATDDGPSQASPASTDDIFYFPPQPDPFPALIRRPDVPARLTLPPRLEKVTAEELMVGLDPNGRPFNSSLSESASYTELLGTITLPDAQVVVAPGFELFANESTADRTEVVDLAASTEATVTILWQVPVDPGRPNPVEVAGARLDLDDRAVARWERASDALLFGIAGFTSGRELTPDDTGDGGYLSAWKEHVHLADHDAEPGEDTLVIFGEENAQYELFLGYTADGTIASVMAFDSYYPWRLAVPDGIPPHEITTREDELIECMDGIRPISHANWCLGGELDALIDSLMNPPQPEPPDYSTDPFVSTPTMSR